MQLNTRNYADYLYLGLHVGVCFQSDVVNWADHLIDQSERGEDWMIALSTSQGRHLLDVFHLLRNVLGISNPGVSFRLLIAKFVQCHLTVSPEHTASKKSVSTHI